MNQREINDIIISWLTISFAFAQIGGLIFNSRGFEAILTNFAVALVAVGTGFVLHELAHKYVAIHYGAHAEFRAWKEGLIFAVVLALINSPIIFAAPGAVYVMGNNISVKKNGIISLAGPLTNIAIAIVLILSMLAFNFAGFVGTVISRTISVNMFLAAFNMIPIFPLDGSKVFTWSKGAWLATMAVAVYGAFLL